MAWFTLHNPLTCANYPGANAGSWFASGECFGARIGFVLLFFIMAFARKWIGEEAGIPFNFFLGILGAELSYLIAVLIIGSMGWSLLIGVILGFACAFFGEQMFGGGE